jgi:hypothetical protein
MPANRSMNRKGGAGRESSSGKSGRSPGGAGACAMGLHPPVFPVAFSLDGPGGTESVVRVSARLSRGPVRLHGLSPRGVQCGRRPVLCRSPKPKMVARRGAHQVCSRLAKCRLAAPPIRPMAVTHRCAVAGPQLREARPRAGVPVVPGRRRLFDRSLVHSHAA